MAFVRHLVIRALFGPTLLWNVLLSLLPGRRWHDVVDDCVVLGALPFPWHVPALHAAGVRGVINTCAEYRGPLAAYRRHGIEQLAVPTVDFSPPTRLAIEQSLAFLAAYAARKERVYVHCKAGRGRSATVVLCWLMTRYGMTAEAAQARLLELRPQVNPNLYRRAVVAVVGRTGPA